MEEARQLTAVSLKDSPKYDEAWVQEQIACNPALLKLGENLIVKDRERILPYGGRLDLLLEDSDQDTPVRYEVELQLGRTDPSHIIRTIEYWEIERRRFPQHQHIMVLVAEDVENRYANILHLLNGECRLPMIVIKLEAFDIDGSIALNFTKVLDYVSPEIDDLDKTNDIVVDKSTWEKNAGASIIDAVHKTFSEIQKSIPDISISYLKHYIGVIRGNRPTNFVVFYPKKNGSSEVCFRHQLSDSELDAASKLGIDLNNRHRRKGVCINGSPTDEQTEFIVKMAKLSYDEYFE